MKEQGKRGRRLSCSHYFFVCFPRSDFILKKPFFPQHLVHESAGVKAQAVEEHLLAEEVHLLNRHEQRGHTGSNDRAAQRYQTYTSHQ